ncbi:hypothetical protein DFJ73DRAFT_964388 [Zopfochytrium polystomum]|nr:hypothetical protein DFJ73DRAFT_964388 [Zopfochytrium polystomum]
MTTESSESAESAVSGTTLAAPRRWMRRSGSFASLPPAVLCEILEHLPTAKHIVAASLACTALRSAATAVASKLLLSFADTIDRLQQHLIVEERTAHRFKSSIPVTILASAVAAGAGLVFHFPGMAGRAVDRFRRATEPLVREVENFGCDEDDADADEDDDEVDVPAHQVSRRKRPPLPAGAVNAYEACAVVAARKKLTMGKPLRRTLRCAGETRFNEWENVVRALLLQIVDGMEPSKAARRCALDLLPMLAVGDALGYLRRVGPRTISRDERGRLVKRFLWLGHHNQKANQLCWDLLKALTQKETKTHDGSLLIAFGLSRFATENLSTPLVPHTFWPETLAPLLTDMPTLKLDQFRFEKVAPVLAAVIEAGVMAEEWVVVVARFSVRIVKQWIFSQELADNSIKVLRSATNFCLREIEKNKDSDAMESSSASNESLLGLLRTSWTAWLDEHQLDTFQWKRDGMQCISEVLPPTEVAADWEKRVVYWKLKRKKKKKPMYLWTGLKAYQQEPVFSATVRKLCSENEELVEIQERWLHSALVSPCMTDELMCLIHAKVTREVLKKNRHHHLTRLVRRLAEMWRPAPNDPLFLALLSISVRPEEFGRKARRVFLNILCILARRMGMAAGRTSRDGQIAAVWSILDLLCDTAMRQQKLEYPFLDANSWDLLLDHATPVQHDRISQHVVGLVVNGLAYTPPLALDDDFEDPSVLSGNKLKKRLQDDSIHPLILAVAFPWRRLVPRDVVLLWSHLGLGASGPKPLGSPDLRTLWRNLGRLPAPPLDFTGEPPVAPKPKESRRQRRRREQRQQPSPSLAPTGRFVAQPVPFDTQPSQRNVVNASSPTRSVYVAQQIPFDTPPVPPSRRLFHIDESPFQRPPPSSPIVSEPVPPSTPSAPSSPTSSEPDSDPEPDPTPLQPPAPPCQGVSRPSDLVEQAVFASLRLTGNDDDEFQECLVTAFARVAPTLRDPAPTEARLWRWLFKSLPSIAHHAEGAVKVAAPRAVRASGCVAFAAAELWAAMARRLAGK